MKITTLEYNANQPITKQITEPLNSVYCVAVKVYKDGQPVSADLSVGGTACTEGPDGTKLAELSSGNFQTMKRFGVTVEGGGVSQTFYLQVQERDLGYFEK